MAPSKPTNHVTKALEIVRGNSTATSTQPCPEVPEDLLTFLEHEFPDRCYDFKTESLEEHIKYSGWVSCIQFLRDRFNEQADIAAEVEEPE